MSSPQIPDIAPPTLAHPAQAQAEAHAHAHAQAAEAVALKKTIASLRKALDQEQCTVRASRMKVSELNARADAYSKSVTALETELKVARAQHSKERVGVLSEVPVKERVDDIPSEVPVLTTRHEAVLAALKETEERLKRTQSALDIHEKDKKTFVKTIQALKDQVQSFQSQQDRLKTEYINLNAMVSELEETLRLSKQEASHLNEMLRLSKQEVSRLEAAAAAGASGDPFGIGWHAAAHVPASAPFDPFGSTRNAPAPITTAPVTTDDPLDPFAAFDTLPSSFSSSSSSSSPLSHPPAEEEEVPRKDVADPPRKGEEQHRQLQAQSAELQAKTAELQAQKSELQAKTAELQAQKSELQAQSAELQAATEESRAEREGQAKVRVELQAQLEESKAEVARLSSEVHRLTSEIFQNEERAAEAQEELRAARAESASEVERLRAEVSRWMSEAHNSQSEHKQQA
jgi:chromosome segregation ATPase